MCDYCGHSQFGSNQSSVHFMTSMPSSESPVTIFTTPTTSDVFLSCEKVRGISSSCDPTKSFCSFHLLVCTFKYIYVSPYASFSTHSSSWGLLILEHHII